MTPAQFCILRALSTGEELSMVELARATSTDRTTLIRTLRPLLRGAWVARRVTAERGRGLRFVLTGAGRVKLSDAAMRWRDAQQAFESRFGARRAARLRHELSQVVRDVARA